MPSRYVLEVTVVSAQGLKNVNRLHGPTRPYAVVWVDPNNKRSTVVDDKGHTSPIWNHTLVMPLPLVPIEDATLSIHVVHAGSEEDTEPLIGWAWISLRDVLDEAGVCNPLKRSLQLMCPSGRPQGEVVVEVCMREPRHRAPDPYCGPPNGAPHPPPQPNPYYATAPLAGGYAYSTHDPPPPQYGSGDEKPAAGYGQLWQEEEKKSKFEGTWMPFAVGAVVGALGGLLAELLAYLIAEGARRALEPKEWPGSGFWLSFFCLVLIFSLALM